MAEQSAPGRRSTYTQQLRDLDELQGTLLPTASLVAESSTPCSNPPLFVSAIPIPLEAQTHAVVADYPQLFMDELELELEAPLIPPELSDKRYRHGGGSVLAAAQQKGLLAATEEEINVLRQNDTIDAYNNQVDLDIDRANQVARIKNYREHRLENAPIVTPPLLEQHKQLPTSAAAQKTVESYFQTKSTAGGYEVKEYDIGEYNAGYSYEMSDYKSDYD